MNKFFILFFCVATSVQAQSSFLTTVNCVNKPQFTISDTAILTKSMPVKSGDFTSRFDTAILSFSNKTEGDKSWHGIGSIGNAQPISESFSTALSKYTMDEGHSVVESMSHEAMVDFASAKKFSPEQYEAMLKELSSTSKPTKPAYADYVILPNGKSDSFVFHDHEATTVSGTIVNISTTSLTAVYYNSLPATAVNGATVVQRAVYQESMVGSGSVPWLIANAPSFISGASLMLNTGSNLFPQNNKGAIGINTSNAGAFQMATSDEGGVIGWVNPSNITNLTLSAGEIYATGQLTADAGFESKTGITIGNSDLSGIRISPNSIAFTSNSAVSYIGMGRSTAFGGNLNGPFVLESNSPGGIILNAFDDASGGNGSIILEINSNIVAKINRKGFKYLGLSDEEILNIENPEEGTEVYSKDHHAKVIWNGSDWTYCACTKKIK